MIRSARRAVVLTGLTVVLVACAAQQEPAQVTVVQPIDGAVDEFAVDRKSAARAFEANGDLAAALVEWRLVAAVKPQESEAQQQIRRLESLVESRKGALLRQGESALSAGRRDDARTAFLKALALDGTDAQATRRLREIERETVLANQLKKDEKALAEYRARHAKPTPSSTPPATDFEAQVSAAFNKGSYRQAIDLADQALKRNPEHGAAAGYRQRSYMALAQRSREGGNYREALTFLDAAAETPAGQQAAIDRTIVAVRSELAEELYTQGLDLMNSDLDRAIEVLNEALSYKPDHAQAQSRLAQAQRMRDRLRALR